MKAALLIVLLVMFQSTFAGNAYRLFLLSKVQPLKACYPTTTVKPMPNARFIPVYEIPKGSVFCRMEDKLTRLTGVWIKIGVK